MLIKLHPIEMLDSASGPPTLEEPVSAIRATTIARNDPQHSLAVLASHQFRCDSRFKESFDYAC
jgi:hypothetical protein